jgi:hypothetical protein
VVSFGGPLGRADAQQVVAQDLNIRAATSIQSARIEVLPPIAQVGPAPADRTDAETAITATFRPVVPGRVAVLSRRGPDGWAKVANAVLDDRGRAEFSAATRRGGDPVSYRVTALPYGRLAAKSTARALSTSWGDPMFADGFDGTALSRAWTHRIQFYNPWGGRSCSKGSPDGVAVADGTLRLSVLADPERLSDRCPTLAPDGTSTGDYLYRLNGHISTQYSADFLYGVTAARIRFPRAQGQHGAFWMQPRGLLETGPTPWGAEIDVIEWYGADQRRDRLSRGAHRPSGSAATEHVGGPVRNPDQYLATRSDRWWRNYHVFSVEWTPEEYIFRIDEHETMRTDVGISHDPEFVILSMLSSDFELGALGGEDRLPQHMDVDWVQIWPQS